MGLLLMRAQPANARLGLGLGLRLRLGLGLGRQPNLTLPNPNLSPNLKTALGERWVPSSTLGLELNPQVDWTALGPYGPASVRRA